MAETLHREYRPRRCRNTAQVQESALEENRCRTLGIRPSWKREFGYYTMCVEDSPRDVAINEENHCRNVVLAKNYPRAAWEWAKGDDQFQRFMQRATEQLAQK